MGGHGGLNILPQKRWNVYNQDNRYKVAQDEEKARKKSAAEKKRQEDGQRQNRRNLLVKRAGGKVSNLEAPDDRVQQKQSFEKERLEARKRGKKSEQTSDAKFDERFKFAYGLQDSKPWYTLPRPPLTTTTATRNCDVTNQTEAEANSESKTFSVRKRKADKHKSDSDSRKKRYSKKERAKALLAGLTQQASGPPIEELRKQRRERESKERRKSHDLLCK